MMDVYYKGSINIFNREIEINKTELHFPYDGDTRMMYLGIFNEAGDEGLCLNDIEVPKLNSLNELQEHILHVKYDGTIYNDDTLGTDILSYTDHTEINNMSIKSNGIIQVYDYYEISIKFNYMQNLRYHVVIDMKVCPCTLNLGSISPDDLINCSSSFVVDIDEIDPYS